MSIRARAGWALPVCLLVALLGPSGADALSLPTLKTPAAGVTVPSVSVSVAGVEVTTPSVGVSEPSASVSSEGVTVSAPEVGVSAPSTPVSGAPPPPAPPAPPSETAKGGHAPASEDPSSAHGAAPATATSAAGQASGTQATTPVAAEAANATALARQAQTGTAASTERARSRRRGNHPQGPTSASATSLRSSAARSPSPPLPAKATRSSHAHARTSGGLLDELGAQVPLPIPVPNWSKPIIAALVLLAVAFGARALASGVRVRRLERQRATMQRDLDVMQAALVPQVPAELDGLEVSVAYRPAEGPAAGGDFYDVFALDCGRVAIILGDVAGHGHEALTQAALTRYTLRAYVQVGLEPRAALALAGRVLEDPTCEHYATVAVAVYDSRSGRLTYSCAGHPPPLVHGTDAFEPLTLCASPPIGWTVPTGRRQTTVSLPAGTIACFFSDGLIEARRGKELLGRERLSELLAALGGRPTAADLLAQVRRAARSTPDDMAACIMTPSASAVYAHVEELELDAGRVRTSATRHFLEACGASACEIARTLRHADEIAEVRGGVLLRAVIRPSDTVVTAFEPLQLDRAGIGGGRSSAPAGYSNAGAVQPGMTSGSPSLTRSGNFAGRFSRNAVMPSTASAD
jgi:hypothetical protein